MKRLHWQILLGVSLVILSFLFYFLHYVIFKDLHHILIYFIGDVAFVFIEVLLVTLIIHKVLEGRAQKQKLQKLNMVIGAFFSEVGTELQARKDLAGSPDSDYEHLNGDIKRVYGQLTRQWLKCTEHLKDSYPYLFSLGMRTNPFDESATPIMQE